MNQPIRLADRVEELKKSLAEASQTVSQWSVAKRESADATVDSKQLSAYYESALPRR